MYTLNYYFKTSIFQRVFTVLLLSFFTLLSFAQERLSDIEGEGYTQRHILKEFDGKKYIIQIDRFDSIRVFQYTEDASFLLHARKFESAYDTSPGFQTTEQFILLKGSEESIAYNFVDDSILAFPYSFDQSFTSWQAIHGDEVVLRQSSSDFSQNEQKLIDLNTGVSQNISNEFTVLGQTANTLHLRACISNDLCYFISMNKNTNVMDTMASTYLYAYQSVYSEDSFVYFEDNLIKRYDLTNKTTDTVFDVNGEATGFRMLATENHYLVNYRLNSDFYFLVIKKDDLTFKLNKVYTNMSFAHYEEPANKLIFGDSEIYVYNILSNELFELESNEHANKTSILDNKYLVHNYFNRVRVQDMETFDFVDSANKRSNFSYEGNSYFPIDEGYLLNFDIDIEGVPQLFRINLNSLVTSVDESSVPYIKTGMEDRATLLKLGDDIVAVEKNIHLIDDDQVIQLNAGPIVESAFEDYKIINDKLYWAEKIVSDVYVYTIENDERVEVSKLPVNLAPNQFLTIGDFTVTDNFVYYISGSAFNQHLVRIDKENGLAVDVSEISTFTSDVVFSKGNYVYYFNNGLQAIDESGNTALLQIPIGFSIITLDFVFDDKLYFSADDGIYQIEGLEAIKILDVTQSFPTIPSIIGNTLIVDDTNVLHLYNNGVWDELNVPSGYQFAGVFDEFIYFLKPVATNTFESSLYHLPTETFVNIPTEFNELRVNNIAHIFDKNILLATSGFFPNQIVHLLEISDDFSTIDKIGEYDSSARTLRSKIATYQDDGLLYSGNRLFLMDEEINLVSIENAIHGDYESVGIINENGYFYFIALHPTLGRQVYRLEAGAPLSTSNILAKEIQIYPNPTTDILNLDFEYFSNSRFQILNRLGQRVKSGVLQTNELSVIELSEGLYYILISNSNGNFYLSEFVKLE